MPCSSRSMIALFALLLALNGPLSAQPAPTLTASSHPWLTRGRTTTLTITGDHLAQASRILLDGPPGIDAQLIPADKPDAKRAVLKVTIAADAPLGERELRLVTPAGVSNKIDLHVTFLPVVPEKEGNNTLENAQPVELPATLHGVINGGADVDAFRFDARKGQRLVFESFAQRAGSPLDTTLKLHDPAGREVARSEDAIGTDSLIAYEVAVDGPHVLVVHDVQYRGGGNYAYRINAGQIPYAQALFPMGGKRGSVVDVRLTGWNLPAATMKLDLTDKPVGRMTLFATPDGAANPLPFIVSEAEEFSESEQNDTPAAANFTTPPLVGADNAVIFNGVIEQPGDIDHFRFRVAKAGKLRLSIEAMRLGSLLDALLTLHDTKGAVIARSDDAGPGNDAAIERDLTPGDYIVSVTDLTSLGGVTHGYRLSLAPPRPAMPDFSVRFFPDVIRLHRGGRTTVQCEITRIAGFNGPVTVALKDPPPGVTAQPLILDNGPASGLFVIEAAADADLRIASLSLNASGKQGDRVIEHQASPLARIEPVKAAYLSVQPPLPFTIDQPRPLTDEEVRNVLAQIAALEQAMLAPHAEADKAMGDWERQLLASVQGDVALSPWKTIGPFSAGSFDEAFDKAFEPEKQADPAKPVGDLKWEEKPQWTDGNVWNEFTGDNAAHYLWRTIEVAADRKLELTLGSDDAIKVWHNGKEVLANKIGRGAAPDQEKLTLDLKAGANKLLIKIVNGSGPSGFYFKAAAQSYNLPAPIVAALRTPADQRSEEHKRELLSHYRSQSSLFAAQRTEIAALRRRIGVREEIAQLRAKLAADTPQLAAAQVEWERNATSNTWSALEFTEMKSTGGARFTKQKDGSILLAASNTPKDTYTLTATVDAVDFTGLRLEALADPKLPAGGPGRAQNGNFVLTQLLITAAPASDPSKQQKVELHSPKATFEQQGWPIANTLDGSDDTGWAVQPQFGQNHSAIYLVKPAAKIQGPVILTITMRHESPHVQHNLGRFRLSTTSAARPELGQPSLPGAIVKLLSIPADKRNAKQKQELAEFHRSISPLLDADRQRLAALEATADAGNPSMKYNQTSTVAFEIKRAPGFTGDITVTAIGYADGRDPQGNPNVITRDIEVTPVVVKGEQTVGALTLKAKDKSAIGTRTIVLVAQATIDGGMVSQVSQTIPVTIAK